MTLKILLVLSCALFGSAFAQSQASSAPTAKSPAKARRRAMPGGERTMRGCIAKDSGGTFFLTPQRGEKVRLAESSDVASHVGQQVKLSGAFVDADTQPSTPNSDGSKMHGVREFRVIHVDVLSATCTAPSSGNKR